MIRILSLSSDIFSGTSSEDGAMLTHISWVEVDSYWQIGLGDTYDVDRKAEGSPKLSSQGVSIEQAIRSAPNEVLVELLLRFWHE
jgi:hypothetical protein